MFSLYDKGAFLDLLSEIPERGGTIRIIDGYPQRPYKHFIYVGTLHSQYKRKTLAAHVDLSLSPSYLKELLPEEWEKLEPLVSGKYFLNSPTESVVSAIEDRMDVDPSYYEDDVKRLALSYVERALAPALAQIQPISHDEVYEHMDLTKGVSAPFSYLGFNDRSTFIQSETWTNLIDNYSALEQTGPYYVSVPKEEIAPVEDAGKKCRTYCVPGYHLLHYQTKYFYKYNQALKKFWWSAYGFTPFLGGTSELWNKIHTLKPDGSYLYPYRFAADIRGYDRRIQLYNVAARKLKHFNINNPRYPYKDIVRWVCKSYLAHFLILHNGDVVVLKTGNRSGSGTTTADNIEAGCEVWSDVLIFVYEKKYGELPSFELVYDQLIALFGDDNLSSVMEEFSLILDENLVAERLRVAHNLELKSFVGGKELSLSQLPFLGFIMVPYKNTCIPQWTFERLLVPLVYNTLENTSVEKFLSQFYSITIMMYSHEMWPQINSIYARILHILSRTNGSPMVKSLVRLGVLDRKALDYFYLGRELVSAEAGMEAQILKMSALMQQEPFSDGLTESAEVNLNEIITCICDHCQLTLKYSTLMGLFFGVPFATPPEYELYKITKNLEKFNQISHAWSVTVKHNSLFAKEVAQIVEPPEFKEGSFNPYGNGQTSTYTINKPSFMHLTPLLVTCSSTCIFNTPVNIVGKGATEEEAFIDWHTQVDVYLEMWSPPPPLAQQLYKYLVNLEVQDPVILEFKRLNETVAYETLKSTFMEGSFNPYGNGQPMTYVQWKKSNQSRIKGKTPAQINAMYKQYVVDLRNAARNKPQGKTLRAAVQNKPEHAVRQAPRPKPSKRETGVEKRSNIKLSGCARAYASSLICPFYWLDKSCENKVKTMKIPDGNPCIPMFPAVKTRKFFGVARGTFGAGSGNPYILFAPHRLANQGASDNVAPPIFSSNGSSSLSNSFPLIDSGVGPVTETTTWLNTDYTQISLVNLNTRGVRFRVVAAGLRVKYTGSAINAGGIYVCVEHPNHLSLSSMTLAEASKLDTYFTINVANSIMGKGDGWVTLTYTPVDVDDFEFQADPIANNLWPNDPIRNHFMGIMIPGAPLGSANFEWEAITHFEVVGVNVTGKTPTPADPLGTAVAVNSIGPATQKEVNTSAPVKELVKPGASDLSVTMTDTAKKMIESVATEILPSIV